MRTKRQVIAFAASVVFIFQSQAQTGDAIFPKGELSTVKNHTGNIWLKELNVGDSTFDPSIAVAAYDAGARLDWHVHPGGQVLLITEGTGIYQERGKPARIVHQGDVIKCLPGVEHWHGASPGSGFAYIAVTPTQKGLTIWLEPVCGSSSNDDDSGEHISSYGGKNELVEVAEKVAGGALVLGAVAVYIAQRVASAGMKGLQTFVSELSKPDK